jgi:hypothetical protein
MLKMPHILMQINIPDRRTLDMEEIAYPKNNNILISNEKCTLSGTRGFGMLG